MDLDLLLLAQVRVESRQRYMALVVHFLTIPLYDVMTLVASGSHRSGGGARTRSHTKEAGLRRLLQDKGASGASRAPVRVSLAAAGSGRIGRSAYPDGLSGARR